MHYAIVAVAQQSLRLYPDLDSYKRDVERFFRLAEMKHARLLVFPERAGLMVVPPLVEGFRTGLLKKADVARGRYRGWWERTRTHMMRGTAKLLGADVQQEIHKALGEIPEFIWQTYVDVFASLAYEYKMTVVAGSGYFKDLDSGILCETATVFGPDGNILGQQARVLPDATAEQGVETGNGWQAIETPLGRLGILMGEEVMYPEIGRLLAYQGVEALIVLAATRDEVIVRLLRDGLHARVTDNQVFGALGFTVGPDPFAPEEAAPYRGRSLVMAPPGMLPRRNAIIVEAGTSTAEVLLTARWDFEALHAHWDQAPIPVRRRLPVDTLGPVLAALYSQRTTLEEAMEALPPNVPPALAAETSTIPPEAPPVSAPGLEASPTPAPGVQETQERAEVASEESATEMEEGHEPPPPPPEAPNAPQAAEEEGTTTPGGGAGILQDESVSLLPEQQGALPGTAAEEAERGEASVSQAANTPSSGERPSPPQDTDGLASSQNSEANQDGSPSGVPPADLETRETLKSEGESAAGKGQPKLEAPETNSSSSEQDDVPSTAAEATSLPSAPPPVSDHTAGESGEIPSSMWATIKAELERAAQVIKSIEQESATKGSTAPPSEGKNSRPAMEEVTPPAGNTSSGWFHRLLGQGRQRPQNKETLDEF